MNDTHNPHHGRNIKRLREMIGMKQETLAAELGGDWNQKKISLLEQKEQVDEPLLQQVAVALKMPVEAIENFDEEKAINIIANTVTTVNDHATGQIFQFNPIINTAEKWLDALEEIKKLHQEKVELYERMLKDRDGMIENLGRLIKK